MDKHGYPDDGELERIEKWSFEDIPGMFAFVRNLWQYADSGYWTQDGRIFKISTAGWSGNEDLIRAMEANQTVWSLTALSWRRGGHYEFELPKWATKQTEGQP